MKNIMMSVLVSITGQFALAHPGEEARVIIESESQVSYQAGSFEYAFQLIDTTVNKIVTVDDLLENQTKKLHMIVYDPSLKEFTHVHPAFDGKIWKVNLNLPVNGNYFVWAQGELSDKIEFSALTRAQVINGKSENTPIPLADVRKVTVGKTTIELAKTKLKVGKMAMLDFKISREDGQKPVMAPYLGALAHVIATPADGDQLIHVHAQATNQPNSGMLHVTFPVEGQFRLWVQFIEHEELVVMPLSVIVTK